MSQSKYTPPPWRAEQEVLHEGKHRIAGKSPTVHAANGARVASVARVTVGGRRCKTAEANARLIAAAPDLLAACQAALPIIEVNWAALQAHATDGKREHVRELLRTAITKAMEAKP